MPFRFLGPSRPTAAVALLSALAVIVAGLIVIAAFRGAHCLQPRGESIMTPAELAPPTRSKETTVVGLSTGDVFGPSAGEELISQLRDARMLGATAIRLDIKWSDVQPECGGGYNWTSVTALMKQAAINGQWVQAVFNSPPAWAISRLHQDKNEPWKCTIDAPHIDAFAAFIQAGVKIFGSQILSIEILNEPNKLIGCFGHAEAYVNLVKAVFRAVRTVDKSIDIQAGGTADVGLSSPEEGVNPTEWYQALRDAGIAPYITRLAIHPYTEPASVVDPTQNRGWQEILRVHELFPSLPLDITEIGWFTSGGNGPPSDSDMPPWHANQAVTERAQAVLMHDMFTAFGKLRRQGIVSRIFVFNLRDSHDGAYGLQRADGTPKPAAAIFQAAAAQYNPA